jgi:ion channel POLLUX/CASTOR
VRLVEHAGREELSDALNARVRGNLAGADPSRDLIGGHGTDGLAAVHPDEQLGSCKRSANGRRRRRLALGAHFLERGEDLLLVEEIRPEDVRVALDARVGRELAGADASRDLIGRHRPDRLSVFDPDRPDLLEEPVTALLSRVHGAPVLSRDPPLGKEKPRRDTKKGLDRESARARARNPMLQRLWNRLKFELERFVVSGPLQRLLFIALVIGFVSVVAGLLANQFGTGFKNRGDAIWWAFLRLTDPGYLGDDQGVGLRVISTIVTVLGYVLFLGALIAIMTQWLNSTMQRLDSGLTPIAANDHVVILGYSSRTAAIVKELLVSEARVERFLHARGAGRLKIAILSERVDLQVVQDLKDRLGSLWKPRQLVLRTGSPLRVDHLHRVDFMHASAILLPAHELAGDSSSTPDGRTIKALLATSTSTRTLEQKRLPLMVAEILDARRVRIAERAYDGPIEILATDTLVARLIVQTVRHPGISMVYQELLAPAGADDVYVRRVPEMDGKSLVAASHFFDEAVVLGVIRAGKDDSEAILAPHADFTIAATDELVFVAKSYDACSPASTSRKAQAKSATGAAAERDTPATSPLRGARRSRRVLVLGWSQKVPALVRELALDPADNGAHQVDIFSTKSAAERTAIFGEELFPNVNVRHIEGDYASPGDLLRADPASYDNVVFMANDRVDSAYESDARTILGHLLLEEVLAKGPKRPAVVVELMSTENVALIGENASETVVSPVILSHILTQVALRRDLNAVYMDLFGSGGAELGLRSVSDYDFGDREIGFGDVQAATRTQGEIALGVRRDGTVELVPPSTDRWKLGSADQIVVVTQVDEERRSSVASVAA